MESYHWVKPIYGTDHHRMLEWTWRYKIRNTNAKIIGNVSIAFWSTISRGGKLYMHLFWIISSSNPTVPSTSLTSWNVSLIVSHHPSGGLVIYILIHICFLIVVGLLLKVLLLIIKWLVSWFHMGLLLWFDYLFLLIIVVWIY